MSKLMDSNVKFGGTFSDTHYMGKQRPDTAPGYHGGGNLFTDPTADIYMVPDFQGESGQGNNQSTDRPMGST
jgi:hypothetical protein